MKNVFVFLFAICASASVFAQAKQVSNPSAEAEIMAVVEETYTAFNSYDAARFAKMFASEAILIAPTGDILKGNKNIEMVHKQMFAEWPKPTSNEHEWIDPKAHFLNANLAIFTGQSKEKSTINGKVVEEQYTYGFLIAKKDNKWLIESAQLTPIQSIPVPGN